MLYPCAGTKLLSTSCYHTLFGIDADRTVTTMAHNLAWVVVPSDTTMHNVWGRVADLMEPYAVDLEVPPYRQTLDDEELQYYGDTEVHQEVAPDGRVRAYRMATENPRGNYDYWMIGGRWSRYDPTTDPANWLPCGLCQGTGRRAHPSAPHEQGVACTGCDGSGRIQKVWSSWPDPDAVAMHAADIIPVADLLDDADEQYPCTLVTPDGRWTELESAAWRPEQREEAAWRERLASLLAPWRNWHLVIVDYHL